jgi:hypothetical protein
VAVVDDHRCAPKAALPFLTEHRRPVERVEAMSSRLLRNARAGAYERLGFDVVGDETFKDLVLARIIEPTSKAGAIRVLGECQRLGLRPRLHTSSTEPQRNV